MIKFFILGHRASGLTRQAALAHLRDVHGRMVVRPPADAGAMPAYYVQNHVIDGAYPAPGGAHAIERDLVTELHFESMAAMQAAVATPYYLDNLRPDEPRFVHDPSVVRLNVVPHRLRDGPHTATKLFVAISRTVAVDDDAWQRVRGKVTARMSACQGLVALTENIVLPPPHGERFVDSLLEAWFDDLATARAAARPSLIDDADGIDRDRSLMILAEEYTEERLRALLG